MRSCFVRGGPSESVIQPCPDDVELQVAQHAVSAMAAAHALPLKGDMSSTIRGVCYGAIGPSFFLIGLVSMRRRVVVGLATRRAAAGSTSATVPGAASARPS